MKLKSSKTTCYFNHAILSVIVCRVLLLKSVCQTICQSILTHNTPTCYSNAYNRSDTNLKLFLGEVLWYSIYVLLAQIRTTWVAPTYLFTYALAEKQKHIGQLKSVNLWSKRGKFSTSKNNTYSSNLADSKLWWKSVELSKLKTLFIFLAKNQWTLKSSHKDISTTISVLRCKRKAKQFEAQPNFKSLLGTKTFSNKTKNQLCLSI